jgi:hypothetical protein
MSESKKEAQIVQLEQANERARMYSQRFWQIPFTYLGIVGVALAAASKGSSGMLRLGAITFCLMGCLVLWIMLGIFGAIHRAVDTIEKMEEALDLPRSVQKRTPTIDIPNFVLVVVGIVVCAIAAWKI